MASVDKANLTIVVLALLMTACSPQGNVFVVVEAKTKLIGELVVVFDGKNYPLVVPSPDNVGSYRGSFIPTKEGPYEVLLISNGTKKTVISGYVTKTSTVTDHIHIDGKGLVTLCRKTVRGLTIRPMKMN